jgi:hypothetical protein
MENKLEQSSQVMEEDKQDTLRLQELRKEYDDIKHKIFCRAIAMGYGIDEGEHVPEFRRILDPAGFKVYRADKIESAGEDEYILTVVRKTC